VLTYVVVCLGGGYVRWESLLCVLYPLFACVCACLSIKKVLRGGEEKGGIKRPLKDERCTGTKGSAQKHIGREHQFAGPKMRQNGVLGATIRARCGGGGTDWEQSSFLGVCATLWTKLKVSEFLTYITEHSQALSLPRWKSHLALPRSLHCPFWHTISAEYDLPFAKTLDTCLNNGLSGFASELATPRTVNTPKGPFLHAEQRKAGAFKS